MLGALERGESLTWGMFGRLKSGALPSGFLVAGEGLPESVSRPIEAVRWETMNIFDETYA